MAATGCCVTVRTLCATTDFFYDLLRGLQDLDLHLLLAEQPLEFANPLMRFPQGTHRDDVLVRGDGRGGARFETSLPLPHHTGLDVQLAGDLRQGLLALQQLLDDSALELHREDASAIRSPGKLAHEALPSCRSRIAPSVSSSIGEQITAGHLAQPDPAHGKRRGQSRRPSGSSPTTVCLRSSAATACLTGPGKVAGPHVAPFSTREEAHRNPAAYARHRSGPCHPSGPGCALLRARVGLPDAAHHRPRWAFRSLHRARVCRSKGRPL